MNCWLVNCVFYLYVIKSPESEPSVPCKDQDIPTFDEWTKLMMENEKGNYLYLNHSWAHMQVFLDETLVLNSAGLP